MDFLGNRFIRFIIFFALLCSFGVSVFFIATANHYFMGSDAAQTLRVPFLVSLGGTMGGSLLFYLAFEVFGGENAGAEYVLRMILFIAGKIVFYASIFIVGVACFTTLPEFDLSSASIAGYGFFFTPILYPGILYFIYYFLLNHAEISYLMPLHFLFAAVGSYLFTLLCTFIASLFELVLGVPILFLLIMALLQFLESRTLKEDGLPCSDTDVELDDVWGRFGEILAAIGNFFISVWEFIVFVCLKIKDLALFLWEKLGVLIEFIGKVFAALFGMIAVLFDRSDNSQSVSQNLSQNYHDRTRDGEPSSEPSSQAPAQKPTQTASAPDERVFAERLTQACGIYGERTKPKFNDGSECHVEGFDLAVYEESGTGRLNVHVSGTLVVRFYRELDVEHALNTLTSDERHEQWRTLIAGKIRQVYDKLNAESGGRCPELNDVRFSTQTRISRE